METGLLFLFGLMALASMQVEGYTWVKDQVAKCPRVNLYFKAPNHCSYYDSVLFKPGVGDLELKILEKLISGPKTGYICEVEICGDGNKAQMTFCGVTPCDSTGNNCTCIPGDARAAQNEWKTKFPEVYM